MAKGFGKFGGSGKMHGPRGVATQKPGVSSQQGSGRLGGGVAVQAGPTGVGRYSASTTNKDYAGTQTPGVSASTKSGGNSKFASGGKGSMFGNTGSTAALGGRTAK